MHLFTATYAINAPLNRITSWPSKMVECDWPQQSHVIFFFTQLHASLHLFTWCFAGNRHRLVWNTLIYIFIVHRCFVRRLSCLCLCVVRYLFILLYSIYRATRCTRVIIVIWYKKRVVQICTYRVRERVCAFDTKETNKKKSPESGLVPVIYSLINTPFTFSCLLPNSFSDICFFPFGVLHFVIVAGCCCECSIPFSFFNFLIIYVLCTFEIHVLAGLD